MSKANSIRLLLCLLLALLLMPEGRPSSAAEVLDVKTEELGRPVITTTSPKAKAQAAFARTHQLSGLVLGGGRALAIIDNGYYKEGDLVEGTGARIKSIEADRVVVTLEDGSEAALRLDLGAQGRGGP